VIAALAALRQNVAGTPGMIAAAALLPPAGFAAVVLLLGRREAVPWPRRSRRSLGSDGRATRRVGVQ
jgi:hypothetical protein